MNRKTIDIPVTPYVYAVLTSTYGSSQIYVDQKKNKSLAILCQIAPIYRPTSNLKLLTKTVTLTMTANLYRAIAERDVHAIGLMWHRQFLIRLYEFMEAQVLAGREAYPAMESYLDRHDVGEDEVSRESAYRAWQYYKKKKNKQNNRDNFKSVRTESVYCVTAAVVQFQQRNQHRRLKPAGIERTVFNFLKIDKTVFDRSRRTRLDIEHRKTLFFIYHKVCGMSVLEISRRTGLAKSTVQHHVCASPDYSDYRVMQKTVHHLLKKLESIPLSVLSKSRRA